MKTYTVEKLTNDIYEDNYSHIDFIENMNSGDCDCSIHAAMELIGTYWGKNC
jgi:hypothetical protein